MTKPKCRCRAPRAPHPRHRCNHRYEDHPGVRAGANREGPIAGVPLTPGMGGEVAALLERTKGKTLESPCGHPISGDHWKGIPDHDGGTPDALGRKYWAFIVCPACGYEAAAWRV